MPPRSEKPLLYYDKPDFADSCTVLESYDLALSELSLYRNPQAKFNSQPRDTVAAGEVADIWIYFPWNNTLIHTVDEPFYFQLRTSRNRYVIAEDEQSRLRDLHVGIAGLSVGSQALSALVRIGGPKKIKIADFDILEFSNLNRLDATLLHIGQDKATLAARKVWELDPFAEISIYNQGLNEGNLDEFLGDPPLNVFIDEMDSFKLKIRAREKCKALGIPVIMATDNGDGIIVDVERFDLEPQRPIFHDRLRGFDTANLENLSYQDWITLAIRVIGEKNISPEISRSVPEIGKRITGIPQLGSSAMLAGGAIAFFTRKLANKEPLASGQYIFHLDSLKNSI